MSDPLVIAPMDACDEHALRRWHAVYHAADVAGRIHPTPFALAEKRSMLLSRSVGERRLAWIGARNGEVLVSGLLVLPALDNTDRAVAGVWTPPGHRRQGHGGAMLDHLLGVVSAAGRSRVLAGVALPLDAPVDGRAIATPTS